MNIRTSVIFWELVPEVYCLHDHCIAWYHPLVRVKVRWYTQTPDLKTFHSSYLILHLTLSLIYVDSLRILLPVQLFFGPTYPAPGHLFTCPSASSRLSLTVLRVCQSTCHLSPVSSATCHLSPATCHLPLVTCQLRHLPLLVTCHYLSAPPLATTCYLSLLVSSATCHLPLATCHLSLVTCRLSALQLVTCHLPLVTCHLSLVTCHLSLVTCHLPLVTCHLPLVTCRLSLVACQLCHLSLVTCHLSAGKFNPQVGRK